jgi:valyl-tRNA synthetase
MPFLTEEIWQNLPLQGESIMIQEWPKVNDDLCDPAAEKAMNLHMNIIKSIRNIRAEMNVAPGKKAEIILFAPDNHINLTLNVGVEAIKRLAGGSAVTVLTEMPSKPSKAAGAVLDGVEIYLPLKGLLDLDKEIARVEKELAQVQKDQKMIKGKLNNSGFISKAPAEVVNKEREKLEATKARQQVLQARLLDLTQE